LLARLSHASGIAGVQNEQKSTLPRFEGHMFPVEPVETNQAAELFRKAVNRKPVESGRKQIQ
jgi:hypothetical protein